MAFGDPVAAAIDHRVVMANDLTQGLAWLKHENHTPVGTTGR